MRISPTRETTDAVTFKLEGALMGDWVPLLERACVRQLCKRKTVELDFEHVSFIDREGVVAVRELIARGVAILRPSSLVRDLLDERDQL